MERRSGVSPCTNLRSASATGSADAFYHRQWEDHRWLGQETWASGGTWQNATYDDYNYQYRWTKTWLPEGQPTVSESATNHVTGIENGTATGWSFWSITWGSGSGSGSGSGTSSSTSWSTSWNPSYDETVGYPGFYAGAYYAAASGGYSGGGGSPEEYFAYIGDAFTDGSSSGSSSGGMFPFAYSDEEWSVSQTGVSTQAQELPRQLSDILRVSSRALARVGAGDGGSDNHVVGGLDKAAARERGQNANDGRKESFGANSASDEQTQALGTSQPTKGWWETFKEWFWSWFSTVGAPPTVGALEAAPGVANAALNRTLLERAYRMEQIYGTNSEEAKYAWQEYEAYKAGKLEEFSRKNPPPKPRPGFPPFRPAWEGPRR